VGDVKERLRAAKRAHPAASTVASSSSCSCVPGRKERRKAKVALPQNFQLRECCVESRGEDAADGEDEREPALVRGDDGRGGMRRRRWE